MTNPDAASTGGSPKRFDLDRLHKFLPLLALALVAIALWAIHRELKTYSIHQIIAAASSISSKGLIFALVATACNYVGLTLYDLTGLRYAGVNLPYRRVAFVSLVSYSFSNNLGMSAFSGGTVRLHFYSAMGLSLTDVGRLSAFSGISFWLGYGLFGGGLFFWDRLVLPPDLHVPFSSLHGLGLVLLILSLTYLTLALRNRHALRIFRLEIPVPSFPMALSQAGVGVLDLLLASSVLYFLLPAGTIPFAYFAAYYLFALIAGLVSQVPGGLGVFESVMLITLGDRIPSDVLMGTLLVYRGIYYLLPLGCAMVAVAVREIIIRTRPMVPAGKKVLGGLSTVVPYIMVLVTFLAGLILLISGALPMPRGHLAFAKDFLPLGVVEASHFLASLIGMGLLIISRGIWRRIDTAWYMGVVLLTAGTALSLLKGFRWIEALFLGIILVLFLSTRKYFRRKGFLMDGALSPDFFLSTGIALAVTVWLGIFSFRHVQYSGVLWWRFAFDGDAPRFLRAEVGAAALLFGYMILRLMRTARPSSSVEPEVPDGAILSLVEQSPRADAWLALLGDKTFLRSESGDAFLMYARKGGSLISMGDPVGNPDEWEDLLWDFREKADAQSLRSVFYQVSAERLNLYIEMGLQIVKLGENGRVPLEKFSLDGPKAKHWRHSLSRGERDGLTFRIVDPPQQDELVDGLKIISDQWMESKNAREKAFSLGCYRDSYVKGMPVALVEKDGKTLAFANLWASGVKDEISPDLMRYGDQAPAGVMEFLFLNTMLWAREQGFRWFDLGMAPLSGLENRQLAPLWNRVGTLVFRHGENFYNFQGLRGYKEKFSPVWEPRYLAYPGRYALGKTMVDIASLIAGDIRGVFGR